MSRNTSIVGADLLQAYKDILHFWQEHSIDHQQGGFYGELDPRGQPVPGAEKGLVLNARILWTFASAYNFLKDPAYLQSARRAYDYLWQHFWDREHGGLYWSVDARGQMKNGRKQIYGQGFAIYGLAEYYRASGDPESLQRAIQLFELIEKHSFDATHGGYLEARDRDWQPLADLRLSAKDANEPKSMNTHLHIIEPYTNLYRVWPDARLAQQIEGLLRVFIDHISDPQSGHFHLFFDHDWSVRSSMVSYGHDIEGAWLLNEAAEILGKPDLIGQVKNLSLRLAQATLNEALAPDGSLYYEKELSSNHLETDRHWWVQAEAMVGFTDAWQKSGDARYLQQAEVLWDYIREKLIDTRGGEWFLRIGPDGKPVLSDPKAGFWKCPYHNTRALMEMYQRLNKA